MRKITFPYVGIIEGSRVWQNAETGVQIVKGKNFVEVGLYYVLAPTRYSNAPDLMVYVNTLTGARIAAYAVAEMVRAEIGDAYEQATAEGRERGESRMLAACDCDGTHAPNPGGHSVACRLREMLDLGQPTIDEQHAEALDEHSSRYWERATEGLPRVPAFPDATAIANVWPYGTTDTVIVESTVIAGFGQGYSTRDMLIPPGYTRQNRVAELREEEAERSPSRRRYISLAHAEALHDDAARGASLRLAALRALDAWGARNPEEAANLLEFWTRRHELTLADIAAVLDARFGVAA